MTFLHAHTDLFLPDGDTLESAFLNTTHMGIGAHQDDLELIALPGILACFGRQNQGFTGVTCTDGAGSPRTGLYADYGDDAMRTVRIKEQRAAAMVGRYRAMLQLGYPSSAVKTAADGALTDDLMQILAAAQPEVVYTHNPADKHDTHIGVTAHAIAALRRLPSERRPKAVFGCEVWRGLDWLPEANKQVLDVSAHENLSAALVGVFDSQIAGGKRYDLASMGRRRANATYLDAHGVDQTQAAIYALDLMPLIENPEMEIGDYVASLIDAFRADVVAKQQRWKTTAS